LSSSLLLVKLNSGAAVNNPLKTLADFFFPGVANPAFYAEPDNLPLREKTEVQGNKYIIKLLYKYSG
jgi:hypothetical protein